MDTPYPMITIPATPEGIPTVRELIGQGIDVNVTLLFSPEVYEQVAEAHIAGLEDYAASGGDVSRPHSVATFLVSRTDEAGTTNARLTYERYKRIYSGVRWSALEAAGARAQRLAVIGLDARFTIGMCSTGETQSAPT